MIFDMIVQVFDSGKNTITWSKELSSVLEGTYAGGILTQQLHHSIYRWQPRPDLLKPFLGVPWS